MNAAPPPRAYDADELDRLDRALAAQLTSSSGLGTRAALLGAASAISMLLLALVATAWLDDARWALSPTWRTVMEVTLWAAVALLALCLLLSLVAVFPRRGWSDRQEQRTQALIARDAAAEGALTLGMIEQLRAVNRVKAGVLAGAGPVLALAFVAMVVNGAVFALKAEPRLERFGGPPPPRSGEPAGLPTAAEQAALVARFAPRVWIHPRERYGPADPGAFLASSALRWWGRSGHEVSGRPDPRRLGAGCDIAPGGCYAAEGYLARELTRPHHGAAGRAAGLPLERGFYLDPEQAVRRGRLDARLTVPMTWELRRRGGELLVSYWFFYGYSVPYRDFGTGRNLLAFAHDGDWENVDVALAADSLEPVRVLFYGHGHPASVAWSAVERVAGSHPVVYSALNSHASYPTRETKEGKASAVCADGSTVLCSYDLRDRGARWDGWDPGLLRPARQQPWYGFGGAWGARGAAGDTTGPLGPSEWKLPSDPQPGELASAPR